MASPVAHERNETVNAISMWSNRNIPDTTLVSVLLQLHGKLTVMLVRSTRWTKVFLALVVVRNQKCTKPSLIIKCIHHIVVFPILVARACFTVIIATANRIGTLLLSEKTHIWCAEQWPDRTWESGVPGIGKW